jgi:hypothetical protein
MHNTRDAWQESNNEQEHMSRTSSSTMSSTIDITPLIEIQQQFNSTQVVPQLLQQQQQHDKQTVPRSNSLTMFQKCSMHVEKLLSMLQPSIQSEEKRMFVFNAISNLLSELGLKVWSFIHVIHSF